MEQAPPPPASKLRTVLLFAGGAIAVGLVAGGGVIFLATEPTSPMERPATGAGFDVAEVPKAQPPSGGASVLPVRAPSSLDMVSAGPSDGGSAPAAPAAPASPMEKAAMGFREAIRSSEQTLSDLARDYTKRYPAIQQYGRDWMSHPDLKKLNDDYMRDHDPIAFLRGLSSSPSFPKLIKKYAGEPSVRGFVQDCFAKAPSGAVGASMDYIAKDKTLDTFVQGLAGQVGLPAGLLTASMAATNGPNPPDVNKLAQQALQGMNLPAGAAPSQQPPPQGKR